METALPTVSTPCVKICRIDEESRICVGCGRTLRDIGEWSRISETERRARMARSLERLAALDAANDAANGS